MYLDSNLKIEIISLLLGRVIKPHDKERRGKAEDILSVDDFHLHNLIGKRRAYAKETLIDEDEFFDPEHDCDFTDLSDSAECTRGDELYERPKGWYRIALKVKGKYPDGDTWLGTKGWRDHSVPGEWPVSYHGTSIKGAKGIIRSHYKAGSGDLYGRGIYSTPDIHVAEREEYAQTFTSKSTGKSYKIILQNRINPKKREICDRFDYWLIPVNEATSAKEEKKIVEGSIRPYGILIKELNDEEEEEDGASHHSDDDDDDDCDDGSDNNGRYDDGSVDDWDDTNGHDDSDEDEDDDGDEDEDDDDNGGDNHDEYDDGSVDDCRDDDDGRDGVSEDEEDDDSDSDGSGTYDDGCIDDNCDDDDDASDVAEDDFCDDDEDDDGNVNYSCDDEEEDGGDDEEDDENDCGDDTDDYNEGEDDGNIDEDYDDGNGCDSECEDDNVDDDDDYDDGDGCDFGGDDDYDDGDGCDFGGDDDYDDGDGCDFGGDDDYDDWS